MGFYGAARRHCVSDQEAVDGVAHALPHLPVLHFGASVGASMACVCWRLWHSSVHAAQISESRYTAA